MLAWINQYLLGWSVPLILITAGIFYAVRLRGFPLYCLGALSRALTERRGEGGVSPLRALSLALAGTLGVGNIVGVSAAIAMGGVGAILWMWVSALCAMLLKYAEIVLAMRYREPDGGGGFHGSAMHYIRACFARLGMGRWGGWLAALFAFLCLINAISMGSVIQVNAIADAFEGRWGISPVWTGGVLALMTLLVIRGGSQRVMRLTDRGVPLMTVGYLVLSVAILILRRDRIPSAFASILRDALCPESAMGGVGGFFLSRSVRYGAMRGLISNEAGCGTAPAAHAVSTCPTPAKQGVFGIVEVFVDTVVLCTVTALVVIVSYGEAMVEKGDFMGITLRAYAAVLGDFAADFMAVAVLCFGFATVLCWAHYGMECVTYLSRSSRLKGAFLWLYSASVAVGAFSAADWVWELADLAIGAMTVINVTVLLMMSAEVREETRLWLSADRRSRRRRKRNR